MKQIFVWTTTLKQEMFLITLKITDETIGVYMVDYDKSVYNVDSIQVFNDQIYKELVKNCCLHRINRLKIY